jgi:hypothetical protein
MDAGSDAASSNLDDGGGLPQLTTCNSFTPTKNRPCPSKCTGGCQDNNTLCVIDCSGINCLSATRTCPDGLACFVSCSGSAACTSTVVKCGDGPCEVLCNGSAACTSLTVECGADRCKVQCDNATTGTNLSFNPGSSCQATKPGCP